MQLDEINKYLPTQENRFIEGKPIIIQSKNDEEKVDKLILFAYASLFEKKGIKWNNILDKNKISRVSKTEFENIYSSSFDKLKEKYKSRYLSEYEKKFSEWKSTLEQIEHKIDDYQNEKNKIGIKIIPKNNNIFKKIFNKKLQQKKQPSQEEIESSFIKSIIRELNPDIDLLKTFGYENILQIQDQNKKASFGKDFSYEINCYQENELPNYIKTNLALTDENTKLIEKLIIENNIEPSKIIPEHVTKECLKNAKYLEQKYDLPYSVEIEIDIDKIGNNFKESKEYTKLLDESLQSKKQQDDFWKAIVNTEHSKEKFTLPDDSIHKEFYDIAISFIDPDKPMPEYFNDKARILSYLYLR